MTGQERAAIDKARLFDNWRKLNQFQREFIDNVWNGAMKTDRPLMLWEQDYLTGLRAFLT